MNTTDSRISTLLTSKFGIEPETIRPDATLEDLGMDSLALVEFAEVLQAEFQVKISDDDLTKATDIDDIITLLADKALR